MYEVIYFIDLIFRCLLRGIYFEKVFYILYEVISIRGYLYVEKI